MVDDLDLCSPRGSGGFYDLCYKQTKDFVFDELCFLRTVPAQFASHRLALGKKKFEQLLRFCLCSSYRNLTARR